TLAVKQVLTSVNVLPKLVTYNFRNGQYQPILNKNGQITKRYPGGIYVQKFFANNASPRYEPVHKPKSAAVKTPRTTKRTQMKKQKRRKRAITIAKFIS
ncbi:16765_t:CDS:1, partial [Gigaspora margarita]